MRKYLPALLTFTYIALFCSKTFSQSLRYSLSLPYLSLGAYTTKQPDPFAFTNNQAALAQVKSIAAGVYGERRFLLADNTVYGLALVFPTGLGNFGVQANYAGFKNFTENKIGLAYARSLGNKLDLGVQFNYYGYRIPAYNSASSVNFEIGAILHLTEKLNAGIHVYNPVGGKLGKSGDEKLASAYKFGLGYDASDNFYVSTELIKEEDKPLNVVGGIQYRFLKQFFARAGFLSETGSGFAGAGVGWNNLRLDISASYHPQLGFSPGLLLIVNSKAKNK
ncbi:MAG: hypothetical protein ABIT07_11920 [Ferruginibacter sp.]